MGEINAVHPFREGNGRVQRELIRCMALQSGYKLDWSKKAEDEVLNASIESIYDCNHLAEVIKRCTTD